MLQSLPPSKSYLSFHTLSPSLSHSFNRSLPLCYKKACTAATTATFSIATIFSYNYQWFTKQSVICVPIHILTTYSYLSYTLILPFNLLHHRSSLLSSSCLILFLTPNVDHHRSIIIIVNPLCNPLLHITQFRGRPNYACGQR